MFLLIKSFERNNEQNSLGNRQSHLATCFVMYYTRHGEPFHILEPNY